MSRQPPRRVRLQGWDAPVPQRSVARTLGLALAAVVAACGLVVLGLAILFTVGFINLGANK